MYTFFDYVAWNLWNVVDFFPLSASLPPQLPFTDSHSHSTFLAYICYTLTQIYIYSSSFLLKMAVVANNIISKRLGSTMVCVATLFK